MKYYGQNSVDKFLHEQYMSTPFPEGSFLELGAMDGVRFSNTKFFEDNMGFTRGVLIEPDPRSFEWLKINRPNCECFHYAVHASLKEVEFLQAPQTAVGCIESAPPASFKEQWHKRSNTVTLPAKPLCEILHDSKIDYIDFWSLDVEGSEMECLKSMDWNIPVGLICVEDNLNEDEIHNFLTNEHNFTYMNRISINGIFVNKNYFRLEHFHGTHESLLHDENA